ncbi:LacI family DNA-binding transcriptional regulator [uncultured Arcticibacterium sp.]|uniref:LacI family DNA-binding transcriptional regulator n=1 Tax=uncultured Arcticibacterium sp. TaxID=2173042 RepID=UPI0030FBBE35
MSILHFMKENSVGIKDIAKLAGVSTGPVDKVLNNRGGVSKATTKRILEAIKELNYTPNILASRLKSAKEYNIAVLFPQGSSDIPFWLDHERGFKDSNKEMAPFGLNLDLYQFDQNEESTFIEQTKTILKKEFDGVLMVPVFKNEALKFTSTLKNKEIPIVLFDTQLPEQIELPFIGQNSKDSGYLAAELMNKCISKDALVLIISVTKKHDNYRHFSLREAGFRSFFDDDSKILKYESIDQNSNTVARKLTEIKKENPSLQGVFVTNGIDVVAPLFQKNKNQTLIGYDLIEKNVNYLKEGLIDFLISQKPYTQAHLGSRLFYDFLIKKKSIEVNNYLPIDIVMKSNIDYYTDLID